MDDTNYLENPTASTDTRIGTGELRWVAVATVDPAILFSARSDD